MDNIATKPSSHDDGLVLRLAISTNMPHKPDGPQCNAGRRYILDVNKVMTMKLRVMEANCLFFIFGSGIPGGKYLGSWDPVIWGI